MNEFVDKLNEFIQPARDFIVRNHQNPVFWTVIVMGGIALFGLVYSSLNKE